MDPVIAFIVSVCTSFAIMFAALVLIEGKTRK